MKKEPLVARNIRIAYMAAFISNLAFFLPVMTLFFQQIVNSVTLVALIFSIQAVTSIVFEIPTGVFADFFGRRKTLILQGFLTLVAITLLAFSRSFWMLALFSFIFAFKNALGSGTDQALLYDSLKQLRKENEYKKIQGRLSTLTFMGAIIGSIAGGFMAGYSIRLPFLLAIPICLIGLLLDFMITEPDYVKEKHKNMLKHTITSFKTLVSNEQLLLLFLFSLFSFGMAESAYHLEQIFYKFVSLPIVYFGMIAAVGSFMGVIGSVLSHPFSERFGDKRTLILSKIFDGIMLLLGAILLGYVGLFFIVLTNFFRAVGSPVANHLMNRQIDSKNRATMLSINSLLNNVGYMVFAPLIGYVTDLYSIAVAFRMSGVLLILTTGFLLFMKGR